MTTKLPPDDLALLDLPDDRLGLHFYARWLVDKAEELGILQDQLTPEIAEIFREKALGLDTDNEDLAGVEKALHVIAGGDLARGGKLLRMHLERQAITIAALDEAKTGRRRQRANAQKGRSDPLHNLIVEMMSPSPSIKEATLLAKLRKLVGKGIIEDITEDQIIYWVPDRRGRPEGGKLAKAKLTGLPHRMSRARKSL